MTLTPDEIEVIKKYRELKCRKFGELLISMASNGTEVVIETRERDKIKVTT